MYFINFHSELAFNGFERIKRPGPGFGDVTFARAGQILERTPAKAPSYKMFFVWADEQHVSGLCFKNELAVASSQKTCLLETGKLKKILFELDLMLQKY